MHAFELILIKLYTLINICLLLIGGEIKEELLQHLKTVQFPVDLNSLSRIEETLTDHYGVTKFAHLSQGSFLQFITSQPQILSALGGQQITSSIVQSTVRERVLTFIQQLKEDNKVCDMILVSVSCA